MLRGQISVLVEGDAVAAHHMTGEEPRIMFLHGWGIGRTEDLAKGVRAALAATHVAK